MKWKIFRILIGLLFIILFGVFATQTSPPDHSFVLAQSYIKDSAQETGAHNVVTGIYLDYRVYDSLFESLLLLISAVGIHYLNKGGHYERKR